MLGDIKRFKYRVCEEGTPRDSDRVCVELSMVLTMDGRPGLKRWSHIWRLALWDICSGKLAKSCTQIRATTVVVIREIRAFIYVHTVFIAYTSSISRYLLIGIYHDIFTPYTTVLWDCQWAVCTLAWLGVFKKDELPECLRWVQAQEAGSVQ